MAIIPLFVVGAVTFALSAEDFQAVRTAAFRAEQLVRAHEADNARAQLAHFEKMCAADAHCLAWIDVGRGRSTLAAIAGANPVPLEPAREQERICARARDTFRAAADRDGEAAAAACVAWALSVQAEHERAMPAAEDALKMAREAGAQDTIRSARFTLLNVHGTTGYALVRVRPADALPHFEAVLSLATELGQRGPADGALDAICRVEMAIGRYREALVTCERLRELREPEGGEGLATALHNLGALHDALGRTGEAAGYYERALPYRETANGVVASRFALAMLAKRKGDGARARKELDEAHRIAAEAHLQNDTSIVLQAIADLDLNAGRLTLARKRYEQARAHSEAAGDPVGEAGALIGLAQVHDRLGDRNKAVSLCERALWLDQQAGNREAEAHALSVLSRILRSTQPERAVLHAKQSVNIYESIQRDLGSGELQRSYAQQRSDRYRTLAELLAETGRLAEAEEALALLKDEEYQEFLRAGPADAPRKPMPLLGGEKPAQDGYEESENRITALGAELRQLRSVASRTPEQEKRLKELKAMLEVEGGRFITFMRKLEAELRQAGAPGVESHEEGTRSIKKLLAQLPPGIVAVYTIAGDHNVRTILVTSELRKGYAPTSPVTSNELTKLVNAFKEAMSSPAADPRPAARALHRVLVEPMKADLEAAHPTTVLWFLDGPLRYVPIGALYDGSAFLVERFANDGVTAVSLTSMQLPSHASWRALGLGVTKAYGGFQALAGVKRELDAVVRERDTEPGLLPGLRLLNERFTRDVLSDLDGKWQVVHIASHFSLNPDAQTESFLLLGDGSRLTLGDLRRLHDPFTGVDLLVLSACETAVVGGRGAEVDGLATLAESQGASAVVATMWRTWDRSTPELMRRFYEVREKGSSAAGPCARAGTAPSTATRASKAEALRVAQCEMARGYLTPKALPASEREGATQAKSHPEFPGWTHPYYWAPFVLIGNAN